MTPNDSDSNQSRFDSSEQSPAKDRMLANQDPGVSRREFLGMTAASLLVAGSLSDATKPESRNGVPHRTLGRTGEKVSLVGLGGYHLGKQSDPEESIRIIRAGIDEGINFLDNCWDYNDGESEIRMGRALRDGYRQRAFLMTKIDGQTKTAAAQQMNESLRRLQTDRIDLYLLHWRGSHPFEETLAAFEQLQRNLRDLTRRAQEFARSPRVTVAEAEI